MKKFLKAMISIVLSMVIGLFLARFIYNSYNVKTNMTFSEKNNVYLLQFGAYENKEIMIENCQNLSSYYYYKKGNLYHVIIGISSNKELIDKIKNSYDLDKELYIKEEKIDNIEFLENLRQYDELIKNTSDNNTIINAEKQVLAKYDTLIIKNE